MPETAILNASAAWDDTIQDSTTPDYGFTRKRPSTRAVAKPAAGRPWSLETSNSGHVFSLGWISRSYLCAQRLKQFYEQYEDGYFTLIDHDGGGRHYVGHFTGEFPIVQTGNDRYDVQGLTFEEIPGVPMIEYPSDWDNDAVALRPLNDYGDLMLSVSGTWAQRTQQSADGLAVTTLYNDGMRAGDWATYEYRGYGFRIWMQSGPACGQVQIILDGAVLGTVDLYNAIDLGSQMVFERGALSLDIHRLKVVMLGTKNAASSSAGATWCMLEAMR